MRRGSPGFTLLEMLIVVGITALLVTAAVQAHLGIRRAQERVSAGLRRERTAEVFLDRLERELNGTLLVVRPSGVDRLSHPFLFFAEDRFESDVDTAAFRFVTRTPARAGPRALAPGLRMVTYGVFTSEDRGGLDLYRQEDPLPGGLEKEIALPEGQLALDGVSTFRVRYLDDEGGWKEDWDSTDIALLDRLPTEVVVTLALDEESPDGELVPGPDHTRTITLPVRPIDFEKLRGAAEAANDPDSSEDEDDESDPDCFTVKQCADRAIAVITGLVKVQILDLTARQYGKECYEPGRFPQFDALLVGVSCP